MLNAALRRKLSEAFNACILARRCKPDCQHTAKSVRHTGYHSLQTIHPWNFNLFLMSAHVLVFVVMQWLPLPFGMTFWLMFAIVSP